MREISYTSICVLQIQLINHNLQFYQDKT